jgi:hypothetical protein
LLLKGGDVELTRNTPGMAIEQRHATRGTVIHSRARMQPELLNTRRWKTRVELAKAIFELRDRKPAFRRRAATFDPLRFSPCS